MLIPDRIILAHRNIREHAVREGEVELFGAVIYFKCVVELSQQLIGLLDKRLW